jgi:hypothetical protein
MASHEHVESAVVKLRRFTAEELTDDERAVLVWLLGRALKAPTASRDTHGYAVALTATGAEAARRVEVSLDLLAELCHSYLE